jgi:PAS domain S-box-containing protein
MMNKDFYKVIIASIVAIMSFWVLDAAVDSFVHHNESFVDSLIFDKQAVAFRSFFSLCFLVFGILMANVVSRQKKAEIKLKHVSDEWKNTFDSISDFVSVHDADFQIVKANKSLVDYADMGYQELIGTHCYKIFHKTSAPIDNCPHQKALDTGKVVTEEIYEPTMGKHLQVSCSPYYDMNQNLIGSVHIAKDITKRKQIEESLRQSLIDKDLLIKEVHHRVKNNLSVIQSLLQLQSQGLTDNESKSHLEDIQNRVKSMSILHDRLSRSEDLAKLNFSEFISSLANHLYHSYKMNPDRVKLNLSIPEIYVDVDIMMPCGLIINEIVSNSFKYAFPDDKNGEVSIKVHEGDDDEIILIVKDNGIGISDSVNLHNTKSLGLQIVSSLINQIHGKADLLHENGMEFRLKFKKSKNW